MILVRSSSDARDQVKDFDALETTKERLIWDRADGCHEAPTNRVRLLCERQRKRTFTELERIKVLIGSRDLTSDDAFSIGSHLDPPTAFECVVLRPGGAVTRSVDDSVEDEHHVSVGGCDRDRDLTQPCLEIPFQVIVLSIRERR